MRVKVGTILFFFLRQGLALSPRLEATNVIMAHCSRDLWGSGDSPTSASQVGGTISMCHRARLIFVFFFVETGVLHVAQASLELLDSNEPALLSFPKCWNYRCEIS